MPVPLAGVVALILTLAATVYLCAAVLPAHKNGHLPRFLQHLHDLFLFKKLYLEVILRFLYLFSTCLCIFFGFLLIFSRTSYYSHSLFSVTAHYEGTAMQGILLLILGPIVLRILFELLMLLILAVKNLMEMNHKLGKVVPPPASDMTSDKSIPNIDIPIEAKYFYCTQCGTRYDTNAGNCPNCGLE